MAAAKKSAPEKKTESETSALNLSSLAPRPGARHRRKRVGIGEGSGNGKTCGKGQKGQRSRSGFSLPAGFEGGQMPIHRRLPKRGFTSRKKTLGVNRYLTLSVADAAAFAAEIGSAEVTLDALRAAGIVRAKGPVKLLAGGEELKAKLTVQVHAASAAARAAVEKAGGSVQIVEA